MQNQNQPENSPAPGPRRFLVFIALVVLSVGQIFLNTTPLDDNVAFPRALWFGVVGVLLLILGQFVQRSTKAGSWFSRFKIPATVAWVLTALIFSGMAVLAMILFQGNGLSNYLPVVTFWIAGGVLYVLAFTHSAFSLQQAREWVKENRVELIWLGGIWLLGIFLRFYKLGAIPRVVDGDEGRVGITALLTKNLPLANPFALWDNFGALYLQMINVMLTWLGQNPFALRLLPAIGGALAIPAVYLLARQIAGKRVAILAVLLLAMSHTHIHFSRIVSVAYIQGTWLVPLELYFFLSGLQKRSAWRAAAGGVLLAIHYSFYVTAQIMTGVLLVYVLLAFIFLRKWIQPVWRQVLAFWGGFVMLLLPEIFYAFENPDQFFSRLNTDGTFQSGWIYKEMAYTGHSFVQILVERILHVFLSLIYYPSFDFYGATVPMFMFIGGTLFIVGMTLALLRTKQPAYLLLNGYFWGAVCAVGIFSIPPSADTYRVLSAFPAAVIMAALGLDYILDSLGMGWKTAPKVYATIAGLVLFSLFISNIWTYYFDFAGKCRYGGDPQTRFASYLGNYARDINTYNNIYLLSDDIFTYGTHSSVDFLSGQRSIINLNIPLAESHLVTGEIVIAPPSRLGELQEWSRTRPGGDLEYEYDCDKVILIAYKVP